MNKNLAKTWMQEIMSDMLFVALGVIVGIILKNFI